MSDWWLIALGTVAGLCTTGSFVPQVVKIWRDGDTDAISKRMYVLTVTAFGLWLAYGVLIRSWPLMVFNVAGILLSGTVLVLKIRHGDATAPAE